MRNLFSRPALSLRDGGSEDARRKDLGRRGEDAAVKALQKRGYRILDRNYLCRTGEIDIIAEHAGCVVFVEVKTRSPRSWEKPEEAITLEKQARIKRAADYYLGDSSAPPPRDMMR
jgi:putative endonuclease